MGLLTSWLAAAPGPRSGTDSPAHLPGNPYLRHPLGGHSAPGPRSTLPHSTR